MGPGSLLLNIIWIIFGGGAMALGWLIAGCVIAITIVGLPWAPAAFRIALYTLIPFGQTVEERKEAGPLSLVGNIVWFILAGWWLALGHLFCAIVLGVTIIGLPFAWAHLKLARLSLMPVGTVIVRAP
ncbi:MAG: YccF domain-containing protein [Proteobacteria bacterium]|nr:YccF domain-containing protein [Pseudomonadota bacterium]